MEDAELTAKRAFAALLYRQTTTKPFEAALAIFPDTGKALEISQTWPADDFVRQEIIRLSNKEAEDKNRLPGHEDLCRKVWSWIDGPTAGLMTFDEKIKAAKLYAELNGLVQKPEANTNVNNNTYHVLEVHNFGENADWERTLANQQQGLLIEGEKLLQADTNANDD